MLHKLKVISKFGKCTNVKLFCGFHVEPWDLRKYTILANSWFLLKCLDVPVCINSSKRLNLRQEIRTLTQIRERGGNSKCFILFGMNIIFGTVLFYQIENYNLIILLAHKNMSCHFLLAPTVSQRNLFSFKLSFFL